MLRRDLRSPFVLQARLESEMEEALRLQKKQSEGEKGADGEGGDTAEGGRSAESNSNEAATKRPKVVIDLEGITERVVPFPVKENNYYAIQGIKGKVLLLSVPNEGRLHMPHETSGPKGVIESYDLETLRLERLIENVSDFSFTLSRDGRFMVYFSRYRARVVKVGEKPPNGDQAGRESGWLDLGRVKVSVQPLAEWRQMFDEAWRLQREQFWDEDMSGIDWEAVHAQYAPLLERVASRSELSDLLWELQGELGTSHAYEMGGEYRHGPQYRQGFLGSIGSMTPNMSV